MLLRRFHENWKIEKPSYKNFIAVNFILGILIAQVIFYSMGLILLSKALFWIFDWRHQIEI